jgi:hypothetical protein
MRVDVFTPMRYARAVHVSAGVTHRLSTRIEIGTVDEL